MFRRSLLARPDLPLDGGQFLLAESPFASFLDNVQHNLFKPSCCFSTWASSPRSSR